MTAAPTAAATATPRSARAGRPTLLAATSAAVLALLAACGGGGGGGGNEPPPAAQPPRAQAASISLEVLGTSASSESGKVTASDPQNLPLTYTVATQPATGGVTVEAASGNFVYTVAGHATATQDTFTVSVSNGRSTPATATVTVRLNGDPLLANQWHIRNTGASALSTVMPTAGHDMNVAGAWAAGASGRGVKVAVVDSGLEIGHEDLAANVDAAQSFDFLSGGRDPTPAAATAGTDHGTQVAGIIGATAFNGKGGRGVAYNARLRGYNLLARWSVANYGAAMGGMAISADNAIFNASFGRPAPSLAPFDEVIVEANADLAALRGGLGALLVNASGNAFEEMGGDGDPPGLCDLARRYRVSCGNPAQDTRMGGMTPIIVGALNAAGKRSSYSTAGSALWVAAPGGEYGFDSAHFDTARLLQVLPTATQPAIISTARTGCAYRDNAPDTANALVTGSHPHAPQCQYTAQMNGTSSAAPNVSATIALMLEVNPRLTARDVKAILMRTAKRVDTALAPVVATDIVPGARVTLDHGWVRNAAGHWFSNWYGFGAVDTSAAVAMARTYSTPLPPMQTTNFYETTPRAGVTVPAMSTTGYVVSAQVSEPFSTVEHVIVFPNLDRTPSLQCNQIEVVSPAGTKSIVLHAANGFTQGSVTGTRLLSNAFYGEPINGTWKFIYYNFCEEPTVFSATLPQQFLFVGR